MVEEGSRSRSRSPAVRKARAAHLSMTTEQRHEMARQIAMNVDKQGNPDRRFHERGSGCVICGRAKHSCSWEYRLTVREKLRTVTGNQCYCCAHACVRLKCTRKLAVIQNVPGLLQLIQDESSFVRADLAKWDEDVCTCRKCKLVTGG
mmetsp:Transcript_17755/g.31731  ORF Transcript_17755/g.31731 Transcript_17755/m.31731 type:complete len:148 (+) Transcript_17755:56-499(+)